MWTEVDMVTPRPEKSPAEWRVLPMDVHLGDRLTDETGEYEVIGRQSPLREGR
jgi:hypothetical protein